MNDIKFKFKRCMRHLYPSGVTKKQLINIWTIFSMGYVEGQLPLIKDRPELHPIMEDTLNQADPDNKIDASYMWWESSN